VSSNTKAPEGRQPKYLHTKLMLIFGLSPSTHPISIATTRSANRTKAELIGWCSECLSSWRPSATEKQFAFFLLFSDDASFVLPVIFGSAGKPLTNVIFDTWATTVESLMQAC
jgi:hypothetical protein